MDVKDVAAVVTGGASGLGQATARRLAKDGAKVTVLDMNADKLAEVAGEIGGLAAPCDVTDPDSVRAALDAGKEAHGPARIVVNCAGVVHGGRVVGKNGPMDLAAFNRVVAINLSGTFNVMSQAAWDMKGLEPMNDAGEVGVVINTTSVAAFEGQFGQCAYAASKGGVAALTLPATRELCGMGVRVMCIAPGIFHTPMFGALPQEVMDGLLAKTIFPKRLGNAEEYADLVAAIVGNPMLNGEVIRLDGGIRLEPR
ncbi:SDR family NAD(P)-dependent oxidoreductase [Roseospirillum parvum]|uniref:NAD(P)-dependent dehydrogenase, short-chain alcohol dehydrogenase family n=1 Tax=Roseospirillum parvum TaxID=83401 RepID=A0A1G7ZU22_9PROT|nr:SDR family NAD(P)-dependent oxidoreductase [Roseospirillum parvum]SDH12183.1 NAD(P)-dependent dehydrogenase, short-chain alcohol dehydrogenase family [Roseospirillum parvum]